MSTTTRSARRLSPFRLSIIIIVGLLVTFAAVASVLTDFLWFQQLGFENVLITQVVAQIGMFLVGFIALGGISGMSLFLAYRSRPIYLKFADQNDPFGAYRQLIEQLRKLVMVGLPILLGIFGGIASISKWDVVLAWFNRSYTGQVDPQFGLDVSFYFFDLPFLSAVTTYASATVLISGLLAAFVHTVFGGIRFNGRRSTISKAARVQVSIMAALYLVVQGVSLWLDQFKTMTNSSGLYTGATYSDVNAVIPGFQILALISAVIAVLFLLTAVIGNWRLPIMATGLMVVSSIILGGVYPWIVQTFQVGPNERTLESVYIDRNIEATRQAYGLDAVENQDYQAKTDTSAGALRADAETTANIRIIDPTLVSASFRQLEQFQQYYNFENHLDVDRYALDGKTQDTVVAVRELNQAGLGSARSWYNDTIVYTHGYGVVAAYGNQASTDGQPVFLQSGIPSKGALGAYEPRIYFGENSPTYSIVGSGKTVKPREFDYSAGNSEADQTYTTFTGNGGPTLGNLFTRLAYAMKFQSEQILLSDAVNDKSQILYKRSPLERVKAVAPYLTLDSDPYPAVVDGKVQWIVDGYTTSANYPYSRAENFSQSIADTSTSSAFGRGSINYIRNSVKATVDAYTGEVKLFAWDTKDPILKTWSKVYPGTLHSVSEMSGQLLSHVRYPADLFKMQRAILGSYHVTDSGSFYSQQDAWMTPNDPVGTNATSTGALQPPYYLTMQVPGTKAPAFSIYSTFIPRSTGESSRNVLRGYLVADSDAGSVAGQVSPNYGKLRLLTLPKALNVPGPGLVQNNFNADSDVSRLLNILRQGSTTVLNGNLLTLPVGGGLLYVQPVYIKSTGETSYPLLKKVLVAFGDKIAFEDTLGAALDSLFGGNSGAATGTTGPVVTPVPGDTTPVGASAALKAALSQARQAMIDKEQAMTAGDWTAYGKAEKALKLAIDAALAASK
jgi:uncharacterized protein